MDSELNFAAYREAVTGTPPGVGAVVTSPDGNTRFAFDGIENGAPSYVVADYGSHFGTDGPPPGGAELAFVRLAQQQLAITSPIVWLVQNEADVPELKNHLSRAGIDQIQVIHRPAN